MKTLLEAYLPTPGDLTTAEMQSARGTLEMWLRDTALAGPLQDTRPGSPFGMWVLDPFAQLCAGMQNATGKLRDDLNVAGVANGVVWDCDFVEAWLAGLGAVRQESLDVVGYVRLEFSANQAVIIPGGTRFVFNTADVFLPFTAELGPVVIRPVGLPVTGPNMYVLTPVSASTYAVVLPLKGYTTQGVPAGSEAKIDPTVALPTLVRAAAVTTFANGRVNNSVPAMARRSMETLFASGFASRGGVVRHLKQTFPDLTGVAATVSGDVEMTRSAATALGVGSRTVDVYTRSSARTVVTQTVRLEYVVSQGNTAVRKFIGTWQPLGVATRVDGVSWAGNTSLRLKPTIFSSSLAPARAPLLSCAYSTLEKMEMVIDMPMNGNLPLITTTQDDSGVYAWFTVTYETDPSIPTMQAFVDAEGVAGMDVLVRAPMQLVISRMVFHYDKEPGVLFNTEQALADVSSYLGGLFAPDRLNPADLNDIVYAAGASRINSVEVQADLRLSCAQYAVEAGGAMPSVNYRVAILTAIQVPQITLNDILALNPVYTDPNAGTPAQHMGAAGRRNVACALLPSALMFHHDL